MSMVLSLLRMMTRVGVCVAVCLLAGCGEPEAIRPQGDAAAAKAALEAALDAWKAGRSPGDAQTDSRLIWIDADWKDGRKLSGYQLVDEPEQNGGHWRVYADLTLADAGKPSKPMRVCYAVTLGESTHITRSDFLN